MVGLRVMSCTNQLGCLMQWQQHSNPIQPEDTHSAQGPSDSTRHVSPSQMCFQLMKWQIMLKEKSSYTWSFVWSKIFRIVLVFQHKHSPNCWFMESVKHFVLLEDYLRVVLLYFFQSTADVIVGIPSTRHAGLTGVSVHWGLYLLISSSKSTKKQNHIIYLLCCVLSAAGWDLIPYQREMEGIQDVLHSSP